MGDVTKVLFGGGTSTSKPVDTTPEELKPLRPVLTEGLTNVVQGQGNPYQGQLVAPITSGEQGVLQKLQGQVDHPDVADLLHKTLTGYFLPGQQGSNPFLQAAIEAAQRPTADALNQTLGRTLPGVFAAAGQTINGGGIRSAAHPNTPGSSAFDSAALKAFTQGGQALGDIASKMSFQGYESERGRQQGAIPLAQQEVSSLIQNLQAQGLPRMIEQMGIDKGIQVFNDQMNRLLQALQITAGAPIATQATKGKQDTYKGMFSSIGGGSPPGGVPAG